MEAEKAGEADTVGQGSQEEQVHLMQMVIEQQKSYIQMQEERMAEKDATIADLRALVGELQSLKANLEETLEEFRRQFFGVRSEKTKKQPRAEAPEEGQPPTEVRSHTRAPRKKKATREELYAALPVQEVKVPLTEEERRCAYCNAPMQTVGYTEVREELRITPAKVERVKYLQEVAVCPECRKDGDGTFVKAAAPTALMPHSPASASAVAYIMFQKVFMGTPYYRQEMAMFQQGLTLPRETMANWFIYCSGNYFLPLYERMHEYLVQRDVLHADETTCQVLHETGRDAEATSWMWIYLTGNDGKEPIVLYDYQQGRGGRHPQEFLKGFHGLLQCDGYQGYNKVEDVILVCCLAHCRRKFYEALPKERQKKRKLLDILSEEAIPEPVLPKEGEIPQWIPAEVGLAYCNRLFFIEKKLKGLSPEERKQKREELEKPVWEGFWKWVSGIQAAGGSKLAKALKYAVNHRETLMNYLLDGRCEISNNAAERRAKSYAVGRKASLFHASEAGAEASAIVYSMVETAKANKLNVFQYLYTVLLYMPDYKNEPAGIEQLLPWSEFIKEHCTGLIDVETVTAENHAPLPY